MVVGMKRSKNRIWVVGTLARARFFFFPRFRRDYSSWGRADRVAGALVWPDTPAQLTTLLDIMNVIDIYIYGSL